MNFNKDIKYAKVYKVEQGFEKNGEMFLKATLKTKEKVLSRAKNVYYFLNEKYTNVKMYGSKEILLELVKRLQDNEMKIIQNKDLPNEQKTFKGKVPFVEICIYDLDLCNFFFPATKTYSYKLIINSWDFKKDKMEKEKHKVVKVEKIIKEYESKIEKLQDKVKEVRSEKNKVVKENKRLQTELDNTSFKKVYKEIEKENNKQVESAKESVENESSQFDPIDFDTSLF